MDLLTIIVPGRSYILCVRNDTYDGKVLRKSDRIIEMSCDGRLVRLDAREVSVVLERANPGRSAAA